MANKNSQQLGIPSGYRLSESNSQNILKVALRHKFEKKVFNLAWLEVDVLQCISDAAYDEQDLRNYIKIVNILSSNRHLKSAVKLIEGVKMTLGGTERHIGNSDNYSLSGNNKGIISTDIFTDILNNMDEKDLNVRKTSYETTNEYKWKSEYCVFRHPSDSMVQLTSSDLWDVIGSGVRNKVRTHLKKCDKLRADIERVSDLVKSILATYTSAVKLCNDSPEFVNYIIDAAVYNKHGKKCTDMGTVDMLKELESL